MTPSKLRNMTRARSFCASDVFRAKLRWPYRASSTASTSAGSCTYNYIVRVFLFEVSRWLANGQACTMAHTTANTRWLRTNGPRRGVAQHSTIRYDISRSACRIVPHSATVLSTRYDAELHSTTQRGIPRHSALQYVHSGLHEPA